MKCWPVSIKNEYCGEIAQRTDTNNEHWHQNNKILALRNQACILAIQIRTVPYAVPRQPVSKQAVEKTIAAFSQGCSCLVASFSCRSLYVALI
jgi:hypothetical protein